MRGVIAAGSGVSAFALFGVLLAGCGGTLVASPGGSSGSADTGASGGYPAAGSGGFSPSDSAGAGGSRSTFSPEACKRASGLPVPSTGGKQTPEADCASGVALGVIDAASSGWDEGGLCCAVGKDPIERACGARAGDACSPTDYCAYEAGEYCGGADAESICKPRPEECIELYAPVCGCDGMTYDNSCFANAAGTGISKAGVCQ